jgi:mRNA interferase MazF
MPTPKPGEVWLVRFPFTDLTATKLRPALVMSNHGEDIIVAGIFSRVPPSLRTTWVLVDAQAAAFGQTGLKRSSIIKTEKIAVIHESIFQRRLGNLSPDLMTKAQVALKEALFIT